MKEFSLTLNELMQLRAARRSECNRAAAHKINAVILLGTDWSLKQVNEALLLDENMWVARELAE